MPVVLENFSCNDCPLHADPGHIRFVPGEGDLNAEIVIIDIGPGRAENLSGSAFQGEASKAFFGMLAQAGMPSDVTKFFTYATKCANVAGDFKSPGSFAFDACLKHIEEEILTIRPKVIISLGVDTAKYVFNLVGKLKDLQGELRDAKIGDHEFKLMVTNRPAQFKHNPAGLETCLADLRKVRKYVRPAEDDKKEAEALENLEFEIITTLPQWLAFKEKALKLDIIGSDIETTGFIPHPLLAGKGSKEILGIGFATSPTSAVFLPLHPKYNVLAQDFAQLLAADLKATLRVLNGMTFHNGNFDLFFMKYYGFEVPGCDYDTFLALHILNENAPRGLEAETHRLRPELGSYWLSVEKYLSKDNGYYDAPLQELAEYCMKDCMVTYSSRLDSEARLFPKGENGVAITTEMGRVFRRVTMPMLHNLVDAQNAGVAVNMAYVETLADKYRLMASDKEHKIGQALGLEINLKSPAQLAAVLYGKQMLSLYGAKKQTKATAILIQIAEKTELSLPILKLTKTKDGSKGSPSTDEETIELLEKQFRGQFPMLQEILKYREYNKILSTYIGGQTEIIDGELVESKGKGVKNSVDTNNRVHTTFNLGKTDTYRLSSERPNMQNIPATVEMRKMFIAGPGCKLVGGDYSQAELRIMATESQDPGLIKAFEMKQDIHSAIASVLFSKPIEECGKKSEERRRTKAINFGLIYGKGAKALAEDLDISEDEAKNFYRMYFERFVFVKMWMDKTKAHAHEFGFVRSIFGRMRHLEPEINDFQQKGKMSHAERQAMNFPIQSAAAECTYIATNRACAEVKKRGMKSRFILNVHDEILFESPLAEAEEMATILKTAAETPIQGIVVPMAMDVGIYDDWSQKQ